MNTNTYKILKQQVFVSGPYRIIPIRDNDKMNIMRWRNEQMFHLRQHKPLDEAQQTAYFTQVVAKLFNQEQPDQLLFSYIEGDRCIGYGGLVHINWVDRNAEISFIMDTSLEHDQFERHWSIYLNLIEELAFRELKLYKIYVYAFDLRPHLYTVLELNDFKKEAELKEHCYFQNAYKSVIIHSKWNRS